MPQKELEHVEFLPYGSNGISTRWVDVICEIVYFVLGIRINAESSTHFMFILGPRRTKNVTAYGVGDVEHFVSPQIARRRDGPRINVKYPDAVFLVHLSLIG